jgi:acyl-CoA reductase-like NAD-dependent aldehyde dehydrogenase
MLIGGETVGEGILSEVTNPYDGTVIDTIIEATPEHVEAAVAAAQAALRPMAELTAYEPVSWRRLSPSTSPWCWPRTSSGPRWPWATASY